MVSLIRGSRAYLAVGGVAAAVFTASLIGLTSGKAPTAAPPSTTTTTTTIVQRLGVDGFDAVAFTVSSPSKGTNNFCALVAKTPEQQARGMMGRKDLGGYDAMFFPFAADTTAQFYMANVIVPLSIAWFDAAGRFVSSTDMPPCTTDASACPRFGAEGPYRLAVEVLAGGFPALGVGTDATLTFGGPCT